MSARKRGLGRGLDALLGVGREPSTAGAEVSPSEGLHSLPVDLLQRGRYQPRMEFRPEALQDLADSIKVQGVVQPIVVRPLNGGRYEIIAGERRWRAAQMAGLHEIPVIVRDVPDRTAMSLALIENIQREDLNPLEEAGALARLINEFEMTHQEVAEAVGRSRAAVSNLLRLLELEQEVKRALESGDLEMGHARALLGLQNAAQVQAAQQVVARGLSVRETERLVKRLQAGPARQSAPRSLDPDVRRLQEELSERLGARVQVQQRSKGGGRLLIEYNSLDELDGILSHLR